MKKLLSLLFVSLSILSFAQCENSFFPFKEGITFEQTNFSQKDKIQGKTISKIISVANNEATVENKIFDSKGKLLTEANYTIICDGNAIKFDFESFIPEETFSQYGDAKVTVDGDFITIPNELAVGQQLEDGSGKVSVDMSAMQMNMDMKLKERKVDTKEMLTTKAGSFDCYKISQNTTVTMDMMGMKRTTETSSISWFAKGVGMVKTENYDKKGDLMGYSVLTSFQSN